MIKRTKLQSVEPDTRSFEIGDICIRRGSPEKFIIQGIDMRSTPGTIIITLGNLIAMGSHDQLIQIQVDSRDISLDDSSLKLRIILPYQDELLEDPNEYDMNLILEFFDRRRHQAFKAAFIKFCKIFKVEYNLARTLFITRLLSWDLQGMFDINGEEWLISRTGRLYVSRFTGGVFETQSGSRTITIKPSVVSSEVAMLKHQRKIINSADLTPLQLSILRMTPPHVAEPSPKKPSSKKHSFKQPESKKKQQQRARLSITSTRPPEYEGFGMIDFASPIPDVRRRVESYSPVKLRIIPLGGRVIGAHKTQVTALNLMNHAEQMLFKWRRTQDPQDRQPVMIPELDTLARVSLFQVIPSTERFNHQHYTDQLIPDKDKTSQEAYERMVMCILANEYLTDIVDPLADLFSYAEGNLPINMVASNLIFSLMYSDLELRLQTPQDAETSSRSTYGPKMDAFIGEVSEMNHKRLLMSNKMKDPTMFSNLYEECKARFMHATFKHDIEGIIRQFFKEKLSEWGIREIDSIPEEKDEGLPSINGSVKHYMTSHPQYKLEDMLKYNLTPAQSKELYLLMEKQPADQRKPATFAHRPTAYARRPIQEGDKFISPFGVIDIVSVDEYSNVLFRVNGGKDVEQMEMDTVTDKDQYIPYPKQGTLYQNSEGIKYIVVEVNSDNDIIAQNGDGNIRKIPFHELAASTIIHDPESYGMRRPTKKRRHKRRNTRKGG